MAVATTAAVGLGLSAAMAGYQVYQGEKNKKDGQRALENYKRQDLENTNPYTDIPVSTVGSDLMREESQRTSANAVDAMRYMGPRGMAYLPSVISANNTANKEARNYLDEQIIKRNYAIAGDDVARRAMEEEREKQDLYGIGHQIQAGRQDAWNGERGLMSAVMYGANNLATIIGNKNRSGTSGTNFSSQANSNPIGNYNNSLPTSLSDWREYKPKQTDPYGSSYYPF